MFSRSRALPAQMSLIRRIGTVGGDLACRMGVPERGSCGRLGRSRWRERSIDPRRCSLLARGAPLASRSAARRPNVALFMRRLDRRSGVLLFRSPTEALSAAVLPDWNAAATLVTVGVVCLILFAAALGLAER